MRWLKKKEDPFSNLFSQLCSHLIKGAETFCNKEARPTKKAEDLRRIEHEADKVVGIIIPSTESHLESDLGSPEDIATLAHLLDDIMDDIEEAADRINIFHLEYSTGAYKLGILLLSAAEKIKTDIELLEHPGKNSKEIEKLYSEIKEMEKTGDSVHRDALRQLQRFVDVGNLSKESDAQFIWRIICTKEVLDLLEKALDTCKSVGRFIESMKKKNA
jgi:uncharacterized protein